MAPRVQELQDQGHERPEDLTPCCADWMFFTLGWAVGRAKVANQLAVLQRRADGPPGPEVSRQLPILDAPPLPGKVRRTAC